MRDNLVSCVCMHSHSCASMKTFICAHVNVILTVVNTVPYFHVFSFHRTYIPSNDHTPIDRNGNGLLCSVRVGSVRHFLLLTCCHIFLKKEEKRTEMTMEDFIAAMLRCKKAKYVVWGIVSAELPAKSLLKDCEDPVIYCDKVSG